MRQGLVYMDNILAGSVTEINEHEYCFEYCPDYFSNPSMPAISLTLPKTQQTYKSTYLFPFFSNMLSEGSNREVQSMLHHVDIDDDFGILLATAYCDTPGAITIKKVAND